MYRHTVTLLWLLIPQFACPVVKDFIGVLPGLGGRNSRLSTVREMIAYLHSCRMSLTKLWHFPSAIFMSEEMKREKDELGKMSALLSKRMKAAFSQ